MESMTSKAKQNRLVKRIMFSCMWQWQWQGEFVSSIICAMCIWQRIKRRLS